jgi:hypothetical protein
VTANDPKVEITLKEVYDTVMATHTVVTGLGPRLSAVEQQAQAAHTLAQSADTRSKENRRYLKWIGTGLGTIFTGGIVATISAWMINHLK